MQIMGKILCDFLLNCKIFYWLIVSEFIVLMTLVEIRVNAVQISKFDTILSVQMNLTKKETNGHPLCAILEPRNVFQQNSPFDYYVKSYFSENKKWSFEESCTKLTHIDKLSGHESAGVLENFSRKKVFTLLWRHHGR